MTNEWRQRLRGQAEVWELDLSCGQVEVYRLAWVPGWWVEAYLWYGRPLGIVRNGLASTDLADAQREALGIIAARLREAADEVERAAGAQPAPVSVPAGAS